MNTKELHEREKCLYPLSDQTLGNIYTHETFYMITACNGTVNCFDFEQTPWGGLFPVYSPSYHTIYINEQCAVCNGLTDGKPWNPYIVCHGSIDIDAILSAVGLRTIASNCYVHFHYPHDDEFTISKLQCYKKRRDSCPDKVELNPNHMTVFEELGLDYDTVVDLCHSSLEFVYIQQRKSGGYRYFKNIFCFLCSGAPLPNKTCTLELVTKFGKFDFAMLLAGKPGVLNPTITPREACTVHDDNKSVCTKLESLKCVKNMFLILKRIYKRIYVTK
ncbi:hypothetical protein DPMN_189228 [Dreissena polymorpha]|uniref:Uncharacterized protein n=1 Tax=Dreissena polymorpha TaxID=45954 RepID=A0A9D4DV49_DREPO|nr:hypothetical protein DPMN_189228 [Dreissena polymorpha]